MFVHEPKVTDKPHSWPHLCASCSDYGSPGRRFFIDMGFDQEFHTNGIQVIGEGRVYLCDICAKNLVDKLQDLLNLMNTKLEDLTFGTRRIDPLPDATEQSTDDSDSGIVEVVEPETTDYSSLSQLLLGTGTTRE